MTARSANVPSASERRDRGRWEDACASRARFRPAPQPGSPSPRRQCQPPCASSSKPAGMNGAQSRGLRGARTAVAPSAVLRPLSPDGPTWDATRAGGRGSPGPGAREPSAGPLRSIRPSRATTPTSRRSKGSPHRRRHRPGRSGGPPAPWIATVCRRRRRSRPRSPSAPARGLGRGRGGEGVPAVGPVRSRAANTPERSTGSRVGPRSPTAVGAAARPPPRCPADGWRRVRPSWGEVAAPRGSVPVPRARGPPAAGGSPRRGGARRAARARRRARPWRSARGPGSWAGRSFGGDRWRVPRRRRPWRVAAGGSASPPADGPGRRGATATRSGRGSRAAGPPAAQPRRSHIAGGAGGAGAARGGAHGAGMPATVGARRRRAPAPAAVGRGLADTTSTTGRPGAVGSCTHRCPAGSESLAARVLEGGAVARVGALGARLGPVFG